MFYSDYRDSVLLKRTAAQQVGKQHTAAFAHVNRFVGSVDNYPDGTALCIREQTRSAVVDVVFNHVIPELGITAAHIKKSAKLTDKLVVVAAFDLVPRHRSAVERLAHTLHRDLCAVVQARSARHRHKYSELLKEHVEIRTALRGARGIVSVEEVQHGAVHLLGI